MVTLNDIAKTAGVSVATVSLALRNHRSISASRRNEIHQLAQRLGYKKNPHVSSLMRHIRSHRKIPKGAVIALVWAHPNPNACKESTFNRHWTGIRQRAEFFGYHVDNFWYNDPNLNAKSLTRILLARGIQGVVIAPYLQSKIELEWHHFALAAMGHAMEDAHLHSSSGNHFANTRIAIENLRRIGYRRIGLATSISHASSRWFSYITACYIQEYIDSSGRLPPNLPRFLLTQKWTQANFRRWFFKEKPDVILTTQWEVMDWLQQMKVKVPDDVGVAVLNHNPSVPELSGINPLSEVIGANAVDLIVQQIDNNEYGPPKYPKQVNVTGIWVAGKTVRLGALQTA